MASIFSKSARHIASALSIVFASSTMAATVDTVGDSFNVSFNGIVDGNLQSGLTAGAHFVLANISSDGHGGENWDFLVTVSNTSSGPVTGSRISLFGFNTDSEVDKNESHSGGAFNVVGSGTIPFDGALELCFKAGGGGHNCAGGGGGILSGNTETFVARLNFNSDIDSLSLDHFAVRYQSISGSAFGNSGMGIGISSQVPVPAPLMLFGSALATLGLKRRNRSE